MAEAEIYDALVIGSGQGGTPLSRTLAEAGLRTALIEREHVGGTCVNEGCTPTKTMVASARVAYLARRGADFGLNATSIHIDMEKVRERKRVIVDQFRNGSQARLEKTRGLDLIFGEAHMLPKSPPAERTHPVRVVTKSGVRLLTAPKIFINVGTRATVPHIPGLAAAPFLDNKSIMELDAVPEHLLILGGGYIGVEFGQMFRRFGSRVTIMQRSERLLTSEDPDVADEIAKILREDGIDLLLSAQATRVSSTPGNISLEVSSQGSTAIVQGSHLLVATGRAPNSDSLEVKAAGIATDARGWIQSNHRLETNIPGIWVLGDVKGGPMFTHISYDDFRVLKANVLEGKSASIDGRMVPYTVFLDPQLGRIGMTEEQARGSGKMVLVFKMPSNRVARALEMDEPRGFWKAVVDEQSGQILGAAILSIEGGEIMAALQSAMMGKLPYPRLRDGIWAHPTLAEGFNNLFV